MPERSTPPPAILNGEHVHDWDSLFPTLLPGCQHALLSQAQIDGSLNAEDLPSANDHSTDRTRVFFHALLRQSPADLLPGFQLAPIEPIDPDLSAAQRIAVAVATQTPDIAIIRGLPGTGKSRVIAEIVRQVTRTGQRILVTSASSAGLDIPLERVQNDNSIVPLRCISRDERTDQLPASALSKSFDAYRRQLIDEPVRHVQLAIQRGEAAIARWRADIAVLDRLQPIADDYQRAIANRRVQFQQFEQTVHGIENAIDEPFAQRLRDCRARHEASLANKDRELAAMNSDLNDLHKQVADAEAKVAAVRRAQTERGVLHRLFGLGSSRLRTQFEAAANDLSAFEAKRGRIVEQIRLRNEERIAAVQAAEEEQRTLVQDEISRLRSDHDATIGAMTCKIEAIEQRFHESAQALSANCPPVDAGALGSVRQVRIAAGESIDREGRDLAFCRRWCEFLKASADQIIAWLHKSVNAVFATQAAVQSDERLADLARTKPFDFVLVDEAHRFSEAELLPMLRRGVRWILVGDFLPEPVALDDHDRGTSPHRSTATIGNRSRNSSTPTRSAFWTRLCRCFEHTVWSREGDRLCCHLRALLPAQRDELETEAVADSPDIELRILTPVSGPPTLVEVLFPESTTFEHALRYLYRELSEVPVPNSARVLHEANGRFTVRYTDDALNSSVQLEPGLQLRLSGNGTVSAIDFDLSECWNRDKAGAWLREHTRSADLGRRIDLDVSYRASLGVLSVISPIFFNRRFRMPPGAEAVRQSAVEFMAVPAEGSCDRRQSENGSNTTFIRCGAGLETDLSDARQREQLSREFRTATPARGLVNLAEARAIVKLIEDVVSRQSSRPADKPCSIAILTTQAAQAGVIRALVHATPAVARSPVSLLVEYAADFRQREADIVVVSLTRSHERRAVSYSDDSSLMMLTVTRARQRLIIVGDPGSLARRARWDGPLDHQDDLAAERERNWASAIIRHLPELSPPIISSCEGPP